MRKLEVYIEIKGEQHLVGFIAGENYQDAVFQYDTGYMDSEMGVPISISLQFQRIADEAEFEGWYFGHFHVDEEVEDVFVCMYDEFVEL